MTKRGRVVINEWKYEALSLNSSRKCRCTQTRLYRSLSDELLTGTSLVYIVGTSCDQEILSNSATIILIAASLLSVFVFFTKYFEKRTEVSFRCYAGSIEKTCGRYPRKILNTCFHLLLIALYLKSFRFHFRFQSEQNHVLVFHSFSWQAL